MKIEKLELDIFDKNFKINAPILWWLSVLQYTNVHVKLAPLYCKQLFASDIECAKDIKDIKINKQNYELHDVGWSIIDSITNANDLFYSYDTTKVSTYYDGYAHILPLSLKINGMISFKNTLEFEDFLSYAAREHEYCNMEWHWIYQHLRSYK